MRQKKKGGQGGASTSQRGVGKKLYNKPATMEGGEKLNELGRRVRS